MRRFFLSLAIPLLTIGILFSVGSAHAGDLDRTDPAATAKAFLMAFKAKDVAAMAPLTNTKNRDMFSALAKDGDKHPAYDEIFGGWRFEAVEKWDGTVEPTRYDDRGRAIVGFATIGDEVAVVVLTKDGDDWGLEDINSPSKQRFDELPTEPADG